MTDEPKAADLRSVKRLLRGVIAGFVVVFLALTVGFLRIEAQAHANCHNSMAARTEGEGLWNDIINKFVKDPADREVGYAEVRRYYDSLPPAAGC